MTSHGEFNWHELQTHDPPTAMAFYAATLGWSFQPEEMSSGDTYWIIMASGNPVGGILKLHKGDSGEDRPDRWVTYIHVDKVDDAAARAEGEGATILREAWDVPGVGRVVMLREPGGAEIGWVTPIHLDSDG